MNRSVTSGLSRIVLAVGLCQASLVMAGDPVRSPADPKEAAAPADRATPEEIRRLLRAAHYPEAESRARQRLAEVEASDGAQSLQAAEALDLLVEALGRAGKANDPRSRELAERAVRIKERILGSEHADLALSLHQLATLLRLARESVAARPLYERALSIREKALGPDHADVASSLDGLANLLLDGGDYAAAKPLYERALAIREKALGTEDPEVASTLAGLGDLLTITGDFAGAKPLYERALAIREKAFGPDHPDVASSLMGLGGYALDTGDTSRAKFLYQRALAIREKSLGPQHPAVASSLNALGNAHADAGDFVEARRCYERALAIRESIMGPEHLDVARVLQNLAIVREDLEDYSGAKPLLERSLRIKEKALGPKHPDVARGLYNLASLMLQMGDSAGAQPLFERTLEIQERVFGPDHPDVAHTLNMLADLHYQAGDYGEAKSLWERALRIHEKAFGPEHQNVALILNNLGVLAYATGDYGKAKTLYERALAIRRETLGPDHPDVAQSLNNVATVLFETGDYARAKPVYEHALAIEERIYGVHHPQVAHSLSNLAILLRRTGDYSEAGRLFERALRIQEKALGPEHAAVAEVLLNLGNLRLATGDDPGAKRLLERALRIQEKALGSDHPDVALTLNSLGILLSQTGEADRAEAAYRRALGIQEKALGSRHPALTRTLGNLGETLFVRGDGDGARALWERTLALRLETLGPDHPDVAEALDQIARLDWSEAKPAAALKRSLEAEAIIRRELQRATRNLSEREALRLEAVRTSALDVALSVLASEVSGAGSGGGSERTWDELVRSRALVLDEMAMRHRAALERSAPEIAPLAVELDSARSRWARLVVRGPDPDHPERYRQLLHEAQVGQERAERALAAKSLAFIEERARGSVDLAAVRRALPAGSALVAFVQYNLISGSPRAPTHAPARITRGTPSYLALIASPGATRPVIVSLGSVDTMDALIHRWRKEAGTAPDDLRSVARYGPIGEALRRALWDPLAAALKGATRVFVVPDGAIHLVSFATLPTGADRYLLETGPLFHYLSTERDLVRSRGARPAGTGLLILGGPDFDASPPFHDGAGAVRVAGAPRSPAPEERVDRPAYRGLRSSCGEFRSLRFPPLPSARAEADEVESLWEGRPLHGDVEDHRVLKLTGAEAGEAAFKRNAAGHRVLHLATHGFFVQGRCASALAGTLSQGTGRLASEEDAHAVENPLLLSGLALAGANRRESARAQEGEEDGILTAEEIGSLDLRGVEWVVLSACETGVGPVQTGEGVIGLRRTFEVAGASSLIMSLWSVSDHPAREWIRRLYQGRMAGLSTADAVREASLGVLRARREAGVTTHPFTWGAFVAAGDWR